MAGTAAIPPAPGAPQKPAKRRARGPKIPLAHKQTVQSHLISMMPMPMVVDQCSASWGKPRKYVMAVIQAVEQEWAEEAALVAPTRRHQIRAGMEALYRLAISKDKLTVAAFTLKELGKLDGCYQPEQLQVEHSGAVGVGISLGALGFKSPEEVESRIDELRARLAAQGPRALQGAQPQAVALAQLAGSNAAPDHGVNGTAHPAIIDATSTEKDGGGS